MEFLSSSLLAAIDLDVAEIEHSYEGGRTSRARSSICLFSYRMSRFVVLFKLSMCRIEYPILGTSPISGDMILIRVGVHFACHG